MNPVEGPRAAAPLDESVGRRIPIVKGRTTALRTNVRWFAAEFLVVVSGVLVALALNAWWQGRTEAARERAYLSQMLTDFRANEREIADVIRRNSAVAGSANHVYRAAHLPVLPPADSIRVWLNDALIVATPNLRTSTWEALIHGGELRLIRSDTLRNRLIAFAGDLATSRDLLGKLTDASMANIQLVYRRVDMYEIQTEQARAANGWADLESRFPVQWEALLRDLEFVGIVQTTSTAARGRAYVLGRLQPAVEELIELLEEELHASTRRRVGRGSGPSGDGSTPGEGEVGQW
jgi:hypothetical protein